MIGTLRVRTRRAGHAAAVLRAVTGARLRPDGLGPGAVLVVRRLADPLPGAFGAGADRTGARRGVSAWERAAAAVLERAMREAARPVTGPVPAGAEAVLFADRSELLAALARDWLAGVLHDRWWWRRLLPRWAGAGADGVTRAWLEDPRYVPAALELLAAEGRAVPFCRALPESSAFALAAATAVAFGGPDLRAAARSRGSGHSTRASAGPLPEPVRPSRHGHSEVRQRGRRDLSEQAPSPRMSEHGRPEQGRPEQGRPEQGRSGQGPCPPAPGQAPRRHAPPWAEAVPESAVSGLTSTQRLLLGTGLALRRCRAVASGQSFWQGVQDWLSAGSADPSGEPVARGVPAGDGAAGRGLARRERTSPRPRPAPDASISGPSDPRAARRDSLRDPDGPQGRTDGDRNAGVTLPDEAGAPDGSRTETGAAGPDDLRLDAFADEPGGGRRAPGGSGTSPDIPQIVVTRLGGLFYLLNVALHLGLYGDFSEPARPGIALDPWDFVTLLGRELLDPPSLRSPAGPAEESTRPPDGSAAFHDDPVWGLLARLAGRSEGEEPGRGFTPPGGLRRWTAEQAASVRARVGLALDRAPADVAALLLVHRATVFATPSRVDVALSLTELPIEIRMSGLDRDPGWLPAAGRIVAFHFD
ncbi:hypothetical protein AB0K60_13235 [Thermopolyspora sp. NPDC052614]|uniref:hypothetical protein n=1 Tax=Thermopolyspora sp. NPDC052614 TaxID=3155682 RepID=UPI00342023BA